MRFSFNIKLSTYRAMIKRGITVQRMRDKDFRNADFSNLSFDYARFDSASFVSATSEALTIALYRSSMSKGIDPARTWIRILGALSLKLKPTRGLSSVSVLLCHPVNPEPIAQYSPIVIPDTPTQSAFAFGLARDV